MDFAVFYEIQVPNPIKHPEREFEIFHEVLAQVELAEEMGFKYFWTVEHHFQPGFAHSSAPEVIYGAVSQRTSTIRIGHGVVLLPYPYNHPVRVAERLNTLDILSKGRLEVGTGRSGTQIELGGFGIPYNETRARWEEALDVITTIWRAPDGRFSFKGKYFDIPERTIVPRQYQKPHPPLWVAATSEETHGLAGRMGLGLLSFTLLVSTEHLGRRIQAYRDGLKEAKPKGQFVNPRAAAFFMTHCAATDKQAREEAERAFLSYARTTLATAIKVPTGGAAGEKKYAHAQFEAADPDKLTLDYLVENDMCIVGSPDTCIKQIERMQSILMMDQLLCMMQFWPIPHQKTMNSIKLFGKYVIPYFSPV